MKLAVLALLTGCLSVTGGAGTDVGLSDSPRRNLSAPLLAGTIFHIKNEVVFEPQIGSILGPLGEHSNAALAYGGRVSTVSHKRRPGFYGGAWYGNRLVHNPLDHTGSLFKASAGVIYSQHIANETFPWLSDGFFAVAAGLTYHHQDQANIGDGDFLGIEVTFTAGFDWPLGLYQALMNWDTNKKD